MTTAKPKLKDLILAELFRVCSKTTEDERAKQTAKKPEIKAKYTEEQLDDIETLLKSMGYGNNTLRANFMRIFSILLKAPELNRVKEKGQKYPLFCVIVIGANNSSHYYSKNKPYIVSHSDKNHCIHEDGSIAHSQFNVDGYDDNTRLATSDEVRQCIDGLTPAQIRSILNYPVFGPITNAVLETSIDTAPQKLKESTPSDEDFE